MFVQNNSYSKNNDKEKYNYSGYRIAFDGKGEWRFGNDFAKNVITLGVDNSLSSHTDSLKNYLLILGGHTFGITGSFGAPEENLILILVMQRKSFAWVCIVIVIVI